MNKEPLRFKNGKFKIMLIGDLHESYDMYSDNAANKADDMNALLTKAVEELNPDLVVYLGDNAGADNEMQMRSVISRILYPVSLRDIPFMVESAEMINLRLVSFSVNESFAQNTSFPKKRSFPE